jgi:hypothetical protein
MDYAHLGRQIIQTQSHFFLKRCIVGMIEDDSVRVDVDAAGIEACALGLDECDAVLHCCAVYLLETKKTVFKNGALVETGEVEVFGTPSIHSSYDSRWRCSASGPPSMFHSGSQRLASHAVYIRQTRLWAIMSRTIQDKADVETRTLLFKNLCVNSLMLLSLANAHLL